MMSFSQFLFRPRGSKKTKWTPEEDDQLRAAVAAHGTDSWGKVGSCLRNRTGKQCRERWVGQLAPCVSKEIWSFEEDALLIEEQARTGNKWAAIAAKLPGRTSIHLKNRWNWLVRHQATLDEPQHGAHPDVLENGRPQQTVFESPPIDDTLFGAAFEAFQATMLL
jgi:hypothetical protein